MFIPPVFLGVIVLLIQLRPASTASYNTSFSYSSFTPNAVDLLYSGSASSGVFGVVYLTTNPATVQYHVVDNDVGRVTYAKPIRLYDLTSGSVADWVTNFTFFIDGSLNNTYTGNGLTFFLAPTNSTFPAENSDGAWLGLAKDTKFVAVEIDTGDSGPSFGDTNGFHMGIDINTISSNVTKIWQWDGKRRLNGEAWIAYNSTTRYLSARMTNRNLQPYTEWNVYFEIDLPKVLPEYVVVGFSASSYLNYESYQISSWNFTSNLIIPDAPPNEPEQPLLNPRPADSNQPRPVVADAQRGKTELVRYILASCLVVLTVVAIAIVAVVVIRRRSDRKDSEERIIANEEDEGKCLWGDEELEKMNESNAAGRHGQDLRVIKAAGKDQFAGPKRFSYAELSAATKGFDEEEKLGHGGFGEVYRGVLKDRGTREGGQVVAVKRLSKGSRHGLREYVAEVTVISRLRHRNLVPLLGWCHEKSERCLVYEYMEGGSLDVQLFAPHRTATATGTAQVQLLSWAQRMRVALDVASALRYLHEEWEQCVVHRDIKTSNVLIDSKSHARLGDFGLARLVDHGQDMETTLVAGTAGYLAPECFFTGWVGKESDVYSFGVVLLEIVCGLSASRPVNGNGTGLVEWVWRLHGAGGLLEGVDKRLGSDYSGVEAECMLMVGLWCTLPEKQHRPAITEVIQVLSFQKGLPKLPSQMPATVFNMLITSSDTKDIDDPAGFPPVTVSSSSSSSS